MTAVDRRTFLRGTAGLAGVFLLDACTRGPAGSARPTSSATGGRPTVRTAGGDFGFPSPFAYQRGPGYWRMSYIYDTLLWKDGSGTLLPWLARDWSASPDRLTYTFRLRPDVRWQDGRPLTADDVAFTFTYLKGKPVSPQVFVRALGVADAQATAADTVQIRLAQPLVTFVGSVAGALPIVPRHVWEQVADPSKATDPRLLVGSGPYRLDTYRRGEGAYLYTANDDFFLGRPYVQRIEMRPIGDELTALQAGEIDVATLQVGRQDLLQPFQRAPFEVLRGSEDFTNALYWNLGKGGALADVQFRRACATAIDRQQIVQQLLTGNGDPGNPGFLPPTHPFYTPVEQYPFDPRRANAMLDAAGYRRAEALRLNRDGQPLRLTLTVRNDPVPPVTNIVVQQLRAIGVDLQVQAVDIPTLDDLTQSGKYEMAITNFGGLGGDPDYLRQVYASTFPAKRFQSVQGYVNPEFDQLAGRQLVTGDENQRRQLVARMQQIVASDVPMLPLFYPRLYAVARADRFDAWYFTPGGFAGGVPTIFNKHAFVTGRKSGLEIRPT